MSKNAITVVSITKSGGQLHAKFRRWNETKLHLRERLTYKVPDPFVLIIVIITRADAFATTTVHQFTPMTALRFLAAKEAEKDRWLYKVADRGGAQ